MNGLTPLGYDIIGMILLLVAGIELGRGLCDWRYMLRGERQGLVMLTGFLVIVGIALILVRP